MKIYFRLLSYARPIEKYAIPYLIFTILAVVFSTLNLALLVPLLTTLFGQSANHEIPARPEHFFDIIKALNYYSYQANKQYGVTKTLQLVCLVIVLSVFLSNIFRYFAERTMENLRIHTLLNLRKAVFSNVMDLHIGYFNNERKGDIISKIASDVQVVQYSVTGTLQVFFKEPLTLLTYLVTLFAISYKLTLMSVLVIPVSAFIISRIVKKLKHQAAASHISYGIMISYLDEALAGIKIIKSFNATGFIKNRFNQENIRYSNIIRSMAKRQQMASPVSEFMGVLMVATIVLYGGSLVTSGKSEMTAASFIAYIALFSQIMRPAKAISDSFSNIHSGLAAGERVLSLIDEQPQLTDTADAVTISAFNQELSFNDVSFAYHTIPVLQHISFTIPKSKSVALVGPSGGGKSTIMDMIPRFIHPVSGTISIDGQNIQHLTADSLRSLMGIVNQDSILFNDTIYNNIAFGKPDARMEDVEAAARIANAHDFITATPKGYQTNIGDKGVKLSGGQRQRICIARAVLSNPPIMLLDEATSALDTESEKLVQEALNNLMKHRTSLVIAHRLSTIQNADNILVLENGRIVEQGTHLELLEQNGLYRKLIDMQTFTSTTLQTT
ncbi:ABC transporter ATP-binding protein [Deminuibacter soli]|uniref:ATP-binding cassette domain-containing protein n=1 Tax=Deminuibacter soli TaxID=2291815 RepID=A0A3E1NIQ7_9BACT|nr:ABC transporter transmembrane domain-containing protein [Deminuibacter soli]RFM27820.1 ATP-binding cassette domain-containing protein [Deminuibacter soli]